MIKSLVGSCCEKHDVRLLTWNRWDKEAKRWKMAGSHDIAYCSTCTDVISMKTGKRFRKKGDFPPDLAKRNYVAAERAHATIEAYKNFAREDGSGDFELGDFLADLLHYADRYSCCHDEFDAAVDYAERHYLGETSDNLADALGVVEVVQVGADGSEKVISKAPGSSREKRGDKR